MALFCKKCRDFILLHNYCDNCLEKIRVEEVVIENRRKEKNKKILLSINSYIKEEIIYIKKEYNHIIYIENTESFSQEIHKILKYASDDILNILKNKFANSFISLKGVIKEDVLDKHIKKLKDTLEIKVLKELSYIEDIEYFDKEDIQNILGIDIEKIFKRNLEEIENLVDFFQESDEVNVFNRLKNIYKIEKTYQDFISTYKKFHTLLSSNKVLKNIEQYISDNIEIYIENFDKIDINIISKDDGIQREISLIEDKVKELEKSVKELKAIKNETFK